MQAITSDPDLIPGARLTAMFGEAEVAHLLASLRDQLLLAVTELEATGTSAHAHRLAGLAGMLDLPDVHRAWLALPEGNDSAVAEARRTALVAVARIKVPELSASNHSTSV